MKKPSATDPELLIETPAIIALRVALATASSDEQTAAAQADLAAAVEARHDAVLDVITDRILADVQLLDDLIFDPRLDAARDRLKNAIDFLITHFSVTTHPTSKREMPPGAVMADVYRRRGPLVHVARALVDLIPSRQLLEYARDLGLVQAARAARRKDVRSAAK